MALEQGEGLEASRDPLPSYWEAGTWYPVTEAGHSGKEVIPLRGNPSSIRNRNRFWTGSSFIHSFVRSFEDIQVVLKIEIDSGRVLRSFIHSFIHTFSNY